MQSKRLERITRVVENRQQGIIVILEDIHDPHNAAAILRTCDALGIQNIWFIFEKEAKYNPKRIGKATSSSANKWVDMEIFSSASSCIRALKKQGYTIIVTALTPSATSLLAHQFVEKKIAIVVGNEHDGVSEEMQTSADTIITIPMLGFVQSVNVSVATAIVLWEITRQRYQSNTSTRMSASEQKLLLRDFIRRSGT